MMQSGLIIAVAVASFNFGTLQERNGSVSHRFMLRNDSPVAVRVCQTFPSCGCTTIACDTSLVAPHDSVAVDVTFNPVNRGGDFYETASVVMASTADTTVVTLSVEGSVVTSEETLMRQYPVRQGAVRLTADTLNMGEVRRGGSKTMYVGVLHDLQTGRHESVPVTFVADDTTRWGAVSRTVHIPLHASPAGSVAAIVVKAIVIPKFPEGATAAGGPRISCQRRIARSDRELSISNTGNSPLLIYRAYTDHGTDLTASRPLTISAGASCRLPLGSLPENTRYITLITNDARRPRVNILFDQ